LKKNPKMKKVVTYREKEGKEEVQCRIQRVQDINDPINFSFYGKSGTGKTTITGTFPKPLLIADVRDRGTKSIKNVSEVFVYPVRSTEDFEDLYWYLLDNPTKYKTLSLDTTTQLAQMVITKFKGKGNMSRRVYGESSSYLNPWLIQFSELPLITVFIAQEKLFGGFDEVDDDEIAPEVGLSIMPSIASTINAAVDVIGNTFIREVSQRIKTNRGLKVKVSTEYCIRIGPHARYLTKIRRDPSLGGEVPKIMVNPSHQKIINLMEGK